MVLAQETNLILLDEPTTFLDLKVQVDLLELLSRLAHEHGRTLLVVLHDLNLAAAYADTLVMMRDGAILHQARLGMSSPLPISRQSSISMPTSSTIRIPGAWSACPRQACAPPRHPRHPANGSRHEPTLLRRGKPRHRRPAGR